MAIHTPYYDLLVYEGSTLIGALVNDNPNKIDTALHTHDTQIANRKTKQTAVSDPTASGTGVDFLSTISQNTNGVITVTKKTVRSMTGASASADGYAGLVPKPYIRDRARFLRGDGQWADAPSYGPATSSAYGLLKIGYTENNKNYAVKFDSSGKAYVTVPWANTTYSNATTSTAGLMSAADKTKLNGIAAGAQVNPGAATQSANGLMSAADKKKLDGIAAGAQVNPSVATTSANGLMAAADKTKLNGIENGAQKNPGAATTSTNGLMSSTDKTKLNGIETGAQKNPGVATTSANGLMSSSDKTKLNGVETGAQKNPGVATASANGLMSAADKAKLDNAGTALSSMLSLLTNVQATTSAQTKSTYSSRKFSDFVDLVFILHRDSEGKRYDYTVAVPGVLWTSGKKVCLYNVGNYEYVEIAYASDTTVTVQRKPDAHVLHVDGRLGGNPVDGFINCLPENPATLYVEIVGIKKV